MDEISTITALGAGFLSFISPCVLPLVPAYISFISGASMEELRGGDRRAYSRRVILNTLMFIAGFSIVFIGLGASATFIGQFLISKAFFLKKIAGAVIVLFGIHMLGIFRFSFLDVEKKFEQRTKPTGAVGSILVGLAFAFGWTPCIGPILAGILAFAATKESVGQGVWLLTAYSLGLGIPFLLTSLGINAFFGFFKRVRGHLRKVEIVSGVLLIGIGILIFTNDLQRIVSYFLPGPK